MSLRIIILIFSTCGILCSHTERYRHSHLSEEDNKKYEDIIKSIDDREILEVLLDPSGHSKPSLEEGERLSAIWRRVHERSDLIVKILEKESVDVSNQMSSKDWDAIKTVMYVLDSIVYHEMKDSEGIVEEVRLRMYPWENLTFEHSTHHGYLASLFRILIFYGDRSDLDLLKKFKDHPDVIIRYGADNAYTRLEERLNEKSGQRNSKETTRRNAQIRGGARQETEGEVAENSNNYENLWWWIIGIILA